MTFEIFMHWFWVAIFAGFGLFLLADPSRYRNIEAYFCVLRLPCSAKDRLLAAAERRKAMENLSITPARIAGSLALLLAVVAAVVQIPPTILYPVLSVGLCGFLGIAYLQLRNRRTKRVAQIEVRTPFMVLPAYWYGLVLISALLPAIDVTSGPSRLPAAIVIVCAFVIIAIAWRLATMPALLSGDDLPVERFVDDRLRFIRTAIALLSVPGVVFVYFSQTIGHGSPVRGLLELAADAIWLSLAIKLFMTLRRSPSTDELNSWQTVA